MPRDRTFVTGTLAAVLAAVLFGMLGPLARFGAERRHRGRRVRRLAGRCSASCSWARCSSCAGASASRLRRSGRCRTAARLALALASCMGLTLNLAMFSAFGLIPIALALMLFYTYPAGVVVVDVAMGHERITASRLAALGLSTLGVVLVLVGGLRPGGRGSGRSRSGSCSGSRRPAAQVVFVTVSRHGYRSVPADGATLVNIGGVARRRDGRRARHRAGRRPRGAVALARPVAGAAPRGHRGSGDVVTPVPDRDPAHRRHADGDPDAPRAGRRRRARGALAGRGPGSRPGGRRRRWCCSARSSSRSAATPGTTRSSSRPPARSSRRRTRSRPGPPPTPRG